MSQLVRIQTVIVRETMKILFSVDRTGYQRGRRRNANHPYGRKPRNDNVGNRTALTDQRGERNGYRRWAMPKDR